jgi:predicted secreted acid phosphatase
MKDVFLEEAEKYPEEWDGIELREYIAGAFDFERYTLDKGRKRRYNDERMINNLKY